jgi:hypothetical protein
MKPRMEIAFHPTFFHQHQNPYPKGKRSETIKAQNGPRLVGSLR